MKDFFNFFFSFDKLMKDRLVPLFYWAAIIFLGLAFGGEFLNGLKLGWLAKLLSLFEFVAKIVIAFVGLRLLCELAIAVFRINDNLSPDGGASELADIDPLAEARRAAEEAAKRTREMTSKAVDKTKSAASGLKDSGEKAADAVEDVVDDAEDAIEEAVEKVKTAAKKTASPKKRTTSTKSTTTKKAPAKKTTAKKTTTTKKAPPKKKNS